MRKLSPRVGQYPHLDMTTVLGGVQLALLLSVIFV